MIRERGYQDSDLANKFNVFLQTHIFKGIRINNLHKGSRVYLSYPKGIEYIVEFETIGNTKFVSFYVENPKNSLVQMLEENIRNDRLFFKHEPLSRQKFRANLQNYKKTFKIKDIGQGSVEIEKKDKEGKMYKEIVPVAYVRREIIDIPLGKEGHLSENFLKWAYDYGLRLLMLLVQQHKTKANSE